MRIAALVLPVVLFGSATLFAGVESDGGLVRVPRMGDGSRTNEVAAVDVRYVTYRQACIEGWAAHPTNDVQRVVWKSVINERRRGPTNPIRILPGQKPRRRP